jgi:hypothetical protein
MLMRANGWPVAAETTTLSHNPSSFYWLYDFLQMSSSVSSSIQRP